MGDKYHLGYTTGVFDLFHIGHLNLLKKAKDHCDYLIVGVSIDEIVTYKKYKPVIPFEERIEIVKSIKYVDEVVAQTNLDKYEAWKKIRFDVLFHGDDLKNSLLWNEYERRLREEGVDLIYLPYTKGTSTTIIRNRIMNDVKL